MAKEKYQTRLEEIDAERVDEFKDELGISTKAEATRRLILAGLDEHERDDSDELEENDEETEKRVTADGSGVTRSVLSDMVAVYSVITLVPSIAYTLRLFGLVEFSVFSLSQLHTASMSAFFVLLLCYGLLQTRFPETVDRALYTRARSVRNVVSPGGD